jgi:hypothetical protein
LTVDGEEQPKLERQLIKAGVRRHRNDEQQQHAKAQVATTHTRQHRSLLSAV